jgi:hypothetical protein
MAGDESGADQRVFDRRNDAIALDEVERELGTSQL